jgi:hypothetical protein
LQGSPCPSWEGRWEMNFEFQGALLMILGFLEITQIKQSR